jgi:hypothetical protein
LANIIDHNQDAELEHIYDIDVLIQSKDLNIRELREKLSELSKQFATASMKFYYVKAGHLNVVTVIKMVDKEPRKSMAILLAKNSSEQVDITS